VQVSTALSLGALSSPMLVPSGFRDATLALGEHVCHFYCSRTHLLCTVLPYIAAGIANGERCYLTCDDALREATERWLHNRFSYRYQGRIRFQRIDKVIELLVDGSPADLKQGLEMDRHETWYLGLSSMRYAMDLGYAVEKVGLENTLKMERNIKLASFSLPLVILCCFDVKSVAVAKIIRIHDRTLNEINAKPAAVY